VHSMSRKVTISTSKLNRKGFRLLSSGGDVEQYKKNPILLWMHIRPWRGSNDDVLPIGTLKNLQLDGDAWVGELEFDMDDAFAARIAHKWDKGIYNMVSPGVTPLVFSDMPEDILPGQRYATITQWRLDEVSVVDIGANDDALAVKNHATGKYVTLSDEADLSFIPIINPKTNKKPTMEKIAEKLGLAKDAGEHEILLAIGARESELTALRSSESQARLHAIEHMVDAAVTEKRIDQKQRAHFVKLGTDAGAEMLKTTLAAMEPTVKPIELIAGHGQPPAGQKKKLGEHTAAELEKLRTDDAQAYKLLFVEAYGFEPFDE